MFGAHSFGSTAFGGIEAAGTGPTIENLSFGVAVIMTTDVVETISTALLVEMIAAQTITTPLHLSMLSATVTSPSNWRPVVTLGGVDISARLTGEIRVEAGENEARIATFSIAPTPGALTLPDWTGQPVTIDIAAQDTDGSAIDARRIFTGVVDVPDYNLSASIVTFNCTDQRQEVLSNLPREWIDTHVAGWHADAVSGTATENYRYAMDRLASVPAALDLDPYQQPRVTVWNIPGDPFDTFTESAIIDGSIGLQLASRADVRNTITTRLQYRFNRLRARVVSAELSIDFNDFTSFGYDFLSRAMVEQALGSLSGWTRRGEINFVDVLPGTYSVTYGGTPFLTIILPQDAPNITTGFAASYYNRWAQSVTEDYAITVTAQASVDALGYARESLSGATLDDEFDATAWTSGEASEPEITLPTLGDVSIDHGATDATDRAAAENAIETLVAQAKTRALESHRSTRVTAAIPIRADIDLDRRIEIDTAIVRASGKVRRLTHRMHIDDGSAVTEFTLAISGFSAVGLMQDDDTPAAPTAPTDPTPAPDPAALGCTIGLYIGRTTTTPPYDASTMIGYSTNMEVGPLSDAGAPSYPHALSVGTPEIEAAVRDPITLPKSATYAVAIPQDILEVTVP